MRTTKRQLRRIIREIYVGEEKWDAYQGYRDLGQDRKVDDYDPRAVAAAKHAVGIVPYPQGGLIEGEIHLYLEETLGLVPNSDEIFNIADEALSVAGIMLDVGPDAL